MSDNNIIKQIIKPTRKNKTKNMSNITEQKKIVIRVPISLNNRVRQTKVSSCVKELVSKFALEHLNDDRKTFKNAWNEWICTEQLLANSSDELKNKLYFSARYYHRKKILNEKDDESVKTNVAIRESIPDSQSTIESEPETKKKRTYKKNDKSIISSIDQHLATLPFGPNGFLVKPSIAFDSFIATANMQPNESNDIKKTYKNRFYMKEKHICSTGAVA